MTEFAEIHDELRGVARDLLGKPTTWSLLAESGWLGLEVPEALDGSGATFAEVAVLLEEMGRAASWSPYLGTVALGVGTLVLLEPGTDRDALLREIASGDRRVAAAIVDGDALVPAPFRLDGTGLHGRAAFVPDAADADRLLVLARDPDGVPVVVNVAPGASGLEVTDQPVLDETRRFGTVMADGVAVDASSVWRFADDPERSAQRLLDRGAVAVACDSLGLSEAMLDATVAYVAVRQQFDRPIGSFQAVKHACADMLVHVSVGRELLAAAVDAVATGEPSGAVAVSMAKSYICGAAVDVVGKAMQLHGGMGYTWESGIHVHLKRAALNRSLFGSPREHRRRLAQRYLTAPTG